MRPVMFMGQIQAFENDGADYIIERLWDGGIRELVLGRFDLAARRYSGAFLCSQCGFLPRL